MQFKYSEISLNQISLGPICVFCIDRCSVYVGFLTKITYIGSLFKVQFIQESGIFRVQLKTGFTVSADHFFSYSFGIILHIQKDWKSTPIKVLILYITLVSLTFVLLYAPLALKIVSQNRYI